MQVLDPQFLADLESGRPLRIDLGSGGKSRPGFYGIDHLPLPGVHVVADLNRPLDLIPDGSIDHVYTRHVLEHVSEFMPLMAEIRRICKPGALVEVIVPHFSNVYGFSDPTHVRLFGLYSMNYFVTPDKQRPLRRVPSFYSTTRFTIDAVRIDFYRQGRIDRLLAGFFDWWVNLSPATQDFYERRLSHWFHAWQVSWRMRPDTA